MRLWGSGPDCAADLGASRRLAPRGADIEQAWPYNGPWTAEHRAIAAEAIAELTRYLAHATRYPSALPSPGTVAEVTAQLSSASARLAQGLSQLHLYLEKPAPLYDDREGRHPRALLDAFGR